MKKRKREEGREERAINRKRKTATARQRRMERVMVLFVLSVLRIPSLFLPLPPCWMSVFPVIQGRSTSVMSVDDQRIETFDRRRIHILFLRFLYSFFCLELTEVHSDIIPTCIVIFVFLNFELTEEHYNIIFSCIVFIAFLNFELIEKYPNIILLVTTFGNDEPQCMGGCRWMPFMYYYAC